jgi:hypothetical protein
MLPPVRTPQQRRRDTLDRLERETDGWVATADARDGTPHLVPLSFLWEGTALLVATASSSRTSRNLQATGRVRVGIGPTRDVVLIEGTVEALMPGEVPDDLADAFAAKSGFDPREEANAYLYFRIRPQRLQAWREVNELEGRELMREGRWVSPD